MITHITTEKCGQPGYAGSKHVIQDSLLVRGILHQRYWQIYTRESKNTAGMYDSRRPESPPFQYTITITDVTRSRTR